MVDLFLIRRLSTDTRGPVPVLKVFFLPNLQTDEHCSNPLLSELLWRCQRMQWRFTCLMPWEAVVRNWDSAMSLSLRWNEMNGGGPILLCPEIGNNQFWDTSLVGLTCCVMRPEMEIRPFWRHCSGAWYSRIVEVHEEDVRWTTSSHTPTPTTISLSIIWILSYEIIVKLSGMQTCQ